MKRLQQKLATPPSIHVAEGATDDQEEGQISGTTDLSLEGVAMVGSEMDRVHIAEKNKAMAAKLKVTDGRLGVAVIVECLLEGDLCLCDLPLSVTNVRASRYS